MMMMMLLFLLLFYPKNLLFKFGLNQVSNRSYVVFVVYTSDLDLGKFTSTEGFSPATPAKIKNIPELAVEINSPVFHTRTKNFQ